MLCKFWAVTSHFLWLVSWATWVRFLWGLKPSAAHQPFSMALSLSVHWHTRFYIAALNVLSIIFSFLDFVSGNLAMTGIRLWTWTLDFHYFGALGVRPGAWTLPYVVAWLMGLIIVIVDPQSKITKVLSHCFSLNCQKYLKTMAYCDGFSTLTPQICCCLYKILWCRKWFSLSWHTHNFWLYNILYNQT